MDYDVGQTSPKRQSAGRTGEGDFPSGFSKKIDASRQRRQPEVMLWDWTAKMLHGDQNIVFDGRRMSFVSSLQAQPGRNQTVTNQLLPPYRTVVALLRAQQPHLNWHGASPSWSNITKALACDQASSYWWQSNKITRTLTKNSRYLCTTGMAALHTYLDPNAKRVCTEGVSAYDLLFEENATTFDESTWRGIRHVYTRQALVDNYPQHKKYLNELPAITQLDNRQRVPDDRLDVWDIYWTDGSGRHGILCGEQWLWTGLTPQKICPLSPYKYTEIPNRLWGMPMLLPLLDPQRQYNRYKNMQLDIADAHSAPVWLASWSSGIPKAMFNNEPNNVIFYQMAGGKPERVPPPQVPQHLFEIANRSLAEMMDLAGVHPTTMGKRSVGVTSGKAMGELKDGDMAQMTDTMQSIQDAVVDQATAALVYWQAYLPEKQMIRYFDPAIGVTVHKELAGTDLLEDAQVFMTEGTLFTIDAESRDEKLLNLASQGIVDPEQLKKQLSFKIDNQSSTKKMVALSMAKDLLQWCQKGGEIELFPTDDLATVKDVFMEFINSPEYYEKSVLAQMALKRSNGHPLAQQALQKSVQIMDYIRDVVVSIETFGQPVQAYQQASTAQVFPRNDPRPDQQMQAIPAAQSATTQQQMLGADMDMRQRGAKVQQAQRSYEAIKGTPGLTGAVG